MIVVVEMVMFAPPARLRVHGSRVARGLFELVAAQRRDGRFGAGDVEAGPARTSSR
jgi:hypothetical protein